MFDTMKIGRRIAELRKQKNLTQPELADAMGVSFQAVSNWERGNSMPDISKLADLSEMLGTTIDDLLGKKNPVIEKLAKNESIETVKASREEITEAAIIAKPRTVEKMAEETDDENLSELLPFLGRDYLSRLADKEYAKGEDVTEFLPFLSTEDVDKLVMRAAADGADIEGFAPFASTEKLTQAALEYIKTGKDPSDLLPFLTTEGVDELLLHAAKKGADIEEFAPFASAKKLAEAALEYIKTGKDPSDLLPFLNGKDVNALANKAIEVGGMKALKPFFPFLDEDDEAE